MKTKQVTCWCSAYSFPHRIGGGKCSGSSWAEYYFNNIGEYCTNCNANPGYCEVATGQESLSECEAHHWHLHYNKNDRYPKSEEQENLELETMYMDHYCSRYMDY